MIVLLIVLAGFMFLLVSEGIEVALGLTFNIAWVLLFGWILWDHYSLGV